MEHGSRGDIGCLLAFATAWNICRMNLAFTGAAAVTVFQLLECHCGDGVKPVCFLLRPARHGAIDTAPVPSVG